MYCSEYLRNKKRAMAQIISPPTGRDSSLWVQMQRFKQSSTGVGSMRTGQMLVQSAEGALASKAHASVCCADTIIAPTELPPTCCDQIVPPRTPINFYSAKKQDCCPVNLPPIGGDVPCCPDLPKNTLLVRFRKRPTTRG